VREVYQGTDVQQAGLMSDPIVRLLPGPFASSPYELHDDVIYYSKVANKTILVPAGFRSDLLSIPWFFRRILPKGGYGKRASIVHDALCVYQPDWSTGKLAARIFLEAMELDGVPRWRRKAMFYAVYLFGPQWD